MFFKKKKKGLLDPDEIFADSASVFDALHSPESKIERPLGRASHVVFLGLVLVGMGYMGARAATLQIESGDKFFAKSQANRFLIRPVFAPRGIIYDYLGIPLVENEPAYGLVFEKSAFLDSKEDLDVFLSALGKTLKKSREEFWEMGFPPENDPGALPQRIFISQEMSPENIVSVASRLDELPGIRVFESFRRVYRDPYAMSHLTGFVGKVSQEELVRHPEFADEEMVGKSGVELSYEEILRGEGGKKIVEVNASGEESRFRLVEEPHPGSDLVLTIDGGLQKTAYEVIAGYVGDEKAASVVALDPRSGAVRALVSFPGFNTNRFGQSLSKGEFDAVLQNTLKPLFNRALSGEFPSGSVIKPLIGAAALEENIIDPQKRIYDVGFIEVPNPYVPGEVSRFVDWRPNPQPRWIDFYEALAQSANVYFYNIGGGFKEQRGLGIAGIKKYAVSFGFGSLLGIDLPGERPGLVPDPDWKRVAEPDDPVWRVGDTYNVSIGQGGVKTTPLQVTAMTAALANGGKLYRPYVASAILEDGEPVRQFTPEIRRDNLVSEESLDHVIQGMRLAVVRGTAGRLSAVSVPVAAKTGTAQIGGKLQPHAWVTAFAPVENPEIAITVMVEHAGEGATVAVPIMRDILQWYFSSR